MHRARWLLPALVLVSCAAPPTEPSVPSSAPAIYGVAGLIPRGFPDPPADAWDELYRGFRETGGVFGVYANWEDRATFDQAVGAARTFGLTPVVGMGATRDVAGGTVASTVRWSDPAERARFVDAIADFARSSRPPYLAIGGEVDRLEESDAVDFDGFVGAYRDAYDAVKEASPATRVFTVFQLEFLRGGGTLSGVSHRERWSLLQRFAGKLDLVAFTTYPFFDYPSPDHIPDDYYLEIRRHTDLPVAFTEIGWPSEGLGVAASPFDGSPAEQAAFVSRFFTLVAPLDPQLALWSFPHDLGQGAPSAFASLALRASDGTPKPALRRWQELVAERVGSD